MSDAFSSMEKNHMAIYSIRYKIIVFNLFFGGRISRFPYGCFLLFSFYYEDIKNKSGQQNYFDEVKTIFTLG
ncbi:hypothetical protein BGI08_07890 [Snodgrassella alvi]|nr:hypothetical protein BGI08_07890 [Snodgrassella alvi]